MLLGNVGDLYLYLCGGLVLIGAAVVGTVHSRGTLVTKYYAMALSRARQIELGVLSVFFVISLSMMTISVSKLVNYKVCILFVIMAISCFIMLSLAIVKRYVHQRMIIFMLVATALGLSIDLVKGMHGTGGLLGFVFGVIAGSIFGVFVSFGTTQNKSQA